MPDPTTRSFTVLDTRTSPGPASAATRGADVHSDTAHVVAPPLDLARVEAGAHVQTERLEVLANGERALDRSSRSVERRQEAVANCLHLGAAVAVELATHRRVVTVEQLAPGSVAELAGPLRGVDDVGEEHCRQHAIGGRALAHAGEELLDLVHDVVAPARCVRQRVAAGEHDQAGVGNVVGEVLGGLDRNIGVVRPVDDERRRLDVRQDAADVHLTCHLEQRRRRPWTR